MTINTPDRTNVTTADAISAFVPCVSKCWDHSGAHHGFEACCLLYTSSVCAAVPRIQILNTMTRPVMMVCARCRGAGLTFILAVGMLCMNKKVFVYVCVVCVRINLYPEMNDWTETETMK